MSKVQKRIDDIEEATGARVKLTICPESVLEHGATLETCTGVVLLSPVKWGTSEADALRLLRKELRHLARRILKVKKR